MSQSEPVTLRDSINKVLASLNPSNQEKEDYLAYLEALKYTQARIGQFKLLKDCFNMQHDETLKNNNTLVNVIKLLLCYDFHPTDEEISLFYPTIYSSDYDVASAFERFRFDRLVPKDCPNFLGRLNIMNAYDFLIKFHELKATSIEEFREFYTLNKARPAFKPKEFRVFYLSKHPSTTQQNKKKTTPSLTLNESTFPSLHNSK